MLVRVSGASLFFGGSYKYKHNIATGKELDQSNLLVDNNQIKMLSKSRDIHL